MSTYVFHTTEKDDERLRKHVESPEAYHEAVGKLLAKKFEKGDFELRPSDTIEDRLVRVESKLDGLRKFTFARMRARS